MYGIKCVFALLIIHNVYGPHSAAEWLVEIPQNGSKTGIVKVEAEFNKNETEREHPHQQSNASLSTVEGKQDFSLKEKKNINITEDSRNYTNTAVDIDLSDKKNEKRDTDYDSINAIKPFLLFPDFRLLSPNENKVKNLEKEELTTNNQVEDKPFLFFKFAFNIQRIPLDNETEFQQGNTSKSSTDFQNLFLESPFQKFLKKPVKPEENKNEKDNLDFLDDFSFLSASGIDDFFPKPEFLFQDFTFRKKPQKRLSRRKREHKKHDLDNNLKMIMNIFDEMFKKSSEELEETNPILDFLNGGDIRNEDKRESNFFTDFPNLKTLEEKPYHSKWKIQRKMKKLGSEPEAEIKNQERPLIVIDKVFKIGEIMNDGQDNIKYSKKKRTGSKGLLDNLDENHATLDSKHVSDFLKQDKQRKVQGGKQHGNQQPRLKEEGKEIPIVSEEKSTILRKNNETAKFKQNKNSQAPASLIEALENLENKLNETGLIKRLKEKSDLKELDGSSKKHVYEDLKKNVTRVLEKFLSTFNNIDNDKLELNEAESFDWSEKETLQNANAVGKRSKKSSDFIDDYIDSQTKDKKIVDLNYLFFSVTLPTLIFFAILLLACFFALQIKGPLCTKLFKPRSVVVVDKDTQFKRIETLTDTL